MISEIIPKEINYKSIIPKGFPSIYKEWDLDPMSNNKQWTNNDIVRFSFQNLGNGVFDCHRSYFQLTVSTNSNDHPVGLLQIDNSAQSFISQTILYSNNRQIERITSYDVIAAYLNDIGLTQQISEGRDSQGYGFSSFDTMPLPKASSNNMSTARVNLNEEGTFNLTTTSSSGNSFPTIGNMYPTTQANQNDSRIINASKLAKGHNTNANIVISGSELNDGIGGNTAMQTALEITGYANNIRTQYHTNYISNKFPQSTSSIPNYELCLNSTVSNNVFPFYYNPNIPYSVYSRNSITETMYPSSQPVTHTVNTANYGFSNLFTPNFTRGTFQPFISATVPQCMLYNGSFNQTKQPIYRKKFKIPLISGVMGVLVDKQQFILIPLKSINTCLLQITLDPYAMFTSGYSDVSELDSTGILIQQKRNYTIEKIKYKLQTYHFLDQQINFHIQASLTKQIIITSPFWQLGNQFQIPGGTQVNNNYVVGLVSTHLSEIVCLFVSNDYQTYSFARKHFRLSNNIKKFWSKVAVDYWPPQPYKGNGGNVMSNNEDDDNSNFVQNIYWTNGFMFQKCPLPRINQYNFAVNQRPYNVTNKNTFYDHQIVNNYNYAFTQNSINADTAMGMSWIHQNRVIGKAAYVISYTPFSNQDFILEGINLSGTSNFQVLFDQDSSNTYPRDQTLYIFGKSSVIVKYTTNGIFTYGR